MAAVRIHNAWEGCGVLIEYLGTASAIVIMNAYTVAAAGDTLVGTKTVVADIDGFAHWVWASAAALAAGTVLRVDATGL